MKIKTLLSLLFICSPALAHNIELGHNVPSVNVDRYGEVILKGKDTAYQTWQSQQMTGKVRVIQAIAGRSSAKEMNAPLMSAITDADFPKQDYQTTTIINQDDAMWGTGSFVKSSAEDSKQEFSWSSIVLDEDGVVASTWQLKPESSAIVVQDKKGQVLFVKEGSLSDAEIEHVIKLVRQSL